MTAAATPGVRTPGLGLTHGLPPGLTPGLTLGPILFNWPAARWRDFYARIADEAPVDRVAVGEVVCSKRMPFLVDEFAPAIERLQRAGKTVWLSSLALPTLARERALLQELMAIPGVLIEANDVSVLARLAGRPHAIGPLVNVYNEGTLACLARLGAVHVCLPPELPRSAAARLAGAAAAGGPDVAIEVWAFGRAPLAISARCYHARLLGLSKDTCQMVCGRDADGLAVDTLDAQKFVAINGVQTLSHACVNLAAEVGQLAGDGVASFRLSPHDIDMVAVAALFRDVIDRRIEGRQAAAHLERLAPFAAPCNGFLYGEPGYRRIGEGVRAT
ncbi:MAG TPA: U32 family peptidase [Burkholderiaceae bacterium]